MLSFFLLLKVISLTFILLFLDKRNLLLCFDIIIETITTFMIFQSFDKIFVIGFFLLFF